MEPLTEIDRAIREAMHVEPSAYFPARIRARVAETPVDSRTPLQGFALAAIAGVAVIVLALRVWPPAQPAAADPSILASRDLVLFSQSPVVLPAEPGRPARAATADDVVISRSEMLALQQLFAGITVAPPPLPAPADELSIPELVIAPIFPLPGDPEGDGQ